MLRRTQQSHAAELWNYMQGDLSMPVGRLAFAIVPLGALCLVSCSWTPRPEAGGSTETPDTVGLLERARVKSLARKRWRKDGRSLVRRVELIESEALSKALKGCRAFRVKVHNPMARIAGRPFFPHTLVLDGETAIFLENGREPGENADRMAADLLTKKGARVSSADQLRQLVEAFAELRALELQEGMPSHPRAREVTKPEDWKFVISETKDGWQVSCSFLTDEIISSFARYRFQVRRDGLIVPKFIKRLFAALGYA